MTASELPLLPYGRQWIDDDDVEAVVDCLRSDYLTQGPRVGEFEAALCRATGSEHAVAVSSGTAALHLAVLALGLGPGEVGVTSPNTFVATANAFRYAGARVALADLDPESGLIDPDSVESLFAELAARGERASLLVPVDFAGQPADLPRLRELADRHGARVLVDAAHSLGATYDFEGAARRPGDGTLEVAAITSFHPVKHVTTAEGGAVLTRDRRTAERVAELRTHGIHRDPHRLRRGAEDPFAGPWWHEQDRLGFNYRLPDLLCALGISQLRRLDAFLARRRELADRYEEGLVSRGLTYRVRPLARLPGRRSSWHLYVVRVRPRSGESVADVATARKALYRHMHSRRILCQVHYIPVHWHPDHSETILPEGGCPGADAYYASCLSLPMFPAMGDGDVERVLDALADWVEADR